MSALVPTVATLPDFSGFWKLDRGASQFGFLPPPKLRTDTISHREPRLQIVTQQRDANGTVTVERDLIVGGDPVQVTIHGRERSIRAFQDHQVLTPALVIETLYHVSGSPRRLEDRLALDETGQWLTIDRLSEQPGGTVRQRLQLRRQSP